MQRFVQNDPTKAVGNIPRSSQAVAGALWVSLNLVLLQQQQQAEMALGRVNICCASKMTSMLHFLPFASASCAWPACCEPPAEARVVRRLWDFVP